MTLRPMGRGVATAALLLSLSLSSCLSSGDSEPVCPPPEPHGYKLGDRLVNQQFTLLDGSPFELHELCGLPAALMFNFYGW